MEGVTAVAETLSTVLSAVAALSRSLAARRPRAPGRGDREHPAGGGGTGGLGECGGSGAGGIGQTESCPCSAPRGRQHTSMIRQSCGDAKPRATRDASQTLRRRLRDGDVAQCGPFRELDRLTGWPRATRLT